MVSSVFGGLLVYMLGSLFVRLMILHIKPPQRDRLLMHIFSPLDEL